MLSLGIDIGGTKAHGLVLDATDRILAERVLPTETSDAGVRRTVLAVAAALASDLGVDPSHYASVGLGIPGFVDHTSGVVETAVNLGITRTDLTGLLAADFTPAVRVENDVKATALGAGLSLGKGYRDLAYVNLGTGLAAAAVSNGRLVRGARNGAGEIGHLAIDPAGELCGCGQRGCLETVVGGPHLARRLGPLGLDLASLAADPRPAAAAERDRLVAALATTLTLVVIAYDSSAVVLGGGILKAASWLRPMVADELRRRAVGSAFLAGLAVADRLVELPSAAPVAAIGAAVVGRKKELRARTDTVQVA
ncbi:MAG: ROK family protein [Propionicimonas sp.]|nr:ROK family protein [Propionicimonas sp.]